MDSLASSPSPQISITHIVLQALDDLDAVVAQIQLSQVHKVLQTLDFGNTVTL